MMLRTLRNPKKNLLERGQVLVVVTLAAVGIIAIVGLALDVGIMFMDNARLRRAVDAAALGAALQVREGYSENDLKKAATEFLLLNGISLDAIHPVDVESCTTMPSLCIEMVGGVPKTFARKLVRVSATADVHLAFLPVIGVDTVPIAASAVSETASLDVILLLDRSESMTNTAPDFNQMQDPHECNAAPNPEDSSYTGYCQPFFNVKKAAVSFVERLFFPYDRVGVVTFDRDYTSNLDIISDCPTNPHTQIPCPDTAGQTQDYIEDKIKALTVYEGDTTGGNNGIYPSGIPSRCYWGSADPAYTLDLYPDICQQPAHAYTDPISGTTTWNYYGLQSQQMLPGGSGVPSGVGTTNTGGGLWMAGQEFSLDPSRPQALWVVILLTDGVANNGYHISGASIDRYYCPSGTWGTGIYCNDLNPWPVTRHVSTDIGANGYDASDFAFDEADFVGLQETATTHGQGALIFTIGLGPDVKKYQSTDTVTGKTGYAGEEFLKYAANVGRGAYFYAPSDAGLQEIFRKIADNIATRLTH